MGFVEAGGVFAGQVLLKALQVFARHRFLVAVVFDHGVGLQGMDHVVELFILEGSTRLEIAIGVVVGIGRPVAVKPDAGNFAVLRAQLAHLAVQEAQVIAQARPLSARKR